MRPGMQDSASPRTLSTTNCFHGKKFIKIPCNLQQVQESQDGSVSLTCLPDKFRVKWHSMRFSIKMLLATFDLQVTSILI